MYSVLELFEVKHCSNVWERPGLPDDWVLGTACPHCSLHWRIESTDYDWRHDNAMYTTDCADTLYIINWQIDCHPITLENVLNNHLTLPEDCWMLGEDSFKIVIRDNVG